MWIGGNHPGRGDFHDWAGGGLTARLVEMDLFLVGIFPSRGLGGVSSDKACSSFELLPLDFACFFMCSVEYVTEVMIRRARSKICVCIAAVCVAAVSLAVCRRKRGGRSSSCLVF